jgi:hypothetical protein
MALGRIGHEQQVYFLRGTFNWNDTGIGSGVVLGVLPAGAMITDIVVVVDTAFNAGTTNNLLLGTAAAGNQLATTSDTAAGSAGAKRVTTGLTLAEPTGDQAVYVTYTQTGTAASAGKARVSLTYTVNQALFA